MPPCEIWTWPLGIESWMTGALITSPSRTIAKYVPTLAAVKSANFCFPSSPSVKSTVRWPVWSAPMLAAETWSPENRTQLIVCLASHRCAIHAGSSFWPALAGVLPSGTKSRRPVVPTRSRIWSTLVTPGISTTIRSVPCTTTSGSVTPDLSIRLRTIWRITARSAGLGTLPSAGSTWYSIRSPPWRSRPSFVSRVRPSVVPIDGRGTATKLSTRASRPMTMIRIGAARRIGAG